MEVDEAMFYSSIKNLFLRENVDHHITVLVHLTGNYFPSLFNYIFFKAIFRGLERTKTFQEMIELLNRTNIRLKLIEIITLYVDMYAYITYRDYLVHVYKFFPNTQNLDPVYQLEGHSYGEEL